MITRICLLILALGVLVLVPPAPAGAAPMYPDLKTLPPRDLAFDVADTGRGPGRTVLRFTNTVWNDGRGSLRVGGDVPPGAGSAPAIQTVVDEDGRSSRHTIGLYEIHPEHQHFHLEGWGRYELWTKAAFDRWVAAGRPSGAQPDLVGSKTTSCVLDEELIATTPQTPYPRVFPDGGCDPTRTGRIDSGLSPGWGDTYDADRYGQWIDLGDSRLRDGDYVLRSVADPENVVHESAGKADPTREGQEANEAMAVFRVSGGRIADSDRPSGTVTINDVASRTSETNVRVRIIGRDDVSGVADVRLSNDGVTWTSWRPYGGSGSSPMSVAWNLADARYGGSTESGVRRVYVQLRDGSGKQSPSLVDEIQLGSGAGDGGGSNSLYRTAVLGDRPVGFWRLGEPGGTMATDETGVLHGTYRNGPALGVPGLLSSDMDTAAKFTSTRSTSVAVPEHPALRPPSGLAVEAWIRPESIPAPGRFASIVTRPESYSLQFNGPQLEFTVIQNGVRRRLQAPVGAIDAGAVHHVVATYDGEQTRLYIDGAPVASGTLTGSPDAGAAGLHIGSWEGWNEFFDGAIDEVGVYGSLLTGLQVKQHHDAGVSSAVGVHTPTGLSAGAASPSRIDLRWVDASDNETGFVLERSTSPSFAEPTSISLPAGTTTYADSGLAAGTQYHYRIEAVTATDSSGWSATASATTHAGGPAPVPAPSGLAARAASASSIDVRWTDASSDETGFELQRSTDPGFATPATIPLPAGATTYADGGLAASRTYHYRVRAVRGTAASGWSAAASATTPAPPASTYASTVAADAPVSHWRLGERSGTTAGDARGANPGVFRFGPALGATGLLGTDAGNSAVRFDGVDDWVSVPDSASLDLARAVTVEAWIRPDAIPGAGAWASIATKAEAYSLQFNGPRLEFTVMRAGVRHRVQAPSGAIAAGRAYHVAGTYDGATQRLYLDGVQVASRAQTGAVSVTSWPLSIGAWGGWGEFFRGTIDEVAVYGQALGADRIAAHRRAGVAEAAAASARAARTTARAARRTPRTATTPARTARRTGASRGTRRAAKATRSGARAARRSRALRAARALGPSQRVTAGLRGPGRAARRRACGLAARCVTTRAAARQRVVARRACAALRRVGRR